VVGVNHPSTSSASSISEIIGGSDWEHSGNAGMLDLVAALRRVQENIERFGGDPGNVTIFGESGAGGKVSALLAMPGLARGECERLQTLPIERLLAAIEPARQAVGPHRWPLLDRYDFGPVVDGKGLPAQPFDPAAPEISDHVPLLIGDTKTRSRST
jgi:para-nitrobenzyl esterase